jgi:hypothetical protein
LDKRGYSVADPFEVGLTLLEIDGIEPQSGETVYRICGSVRYWLIGLLAVSYWLLDIYRPENNYTNK